MNASWEVHVRVMPRLRLQLRIVLARRPWIHWLLVAATAGVAATVVAVGLADVRRARDAWGHTTEVVVATRELHAGDALAGAVATRSVPLALVPASALAPSILDGAADVTVMQHVAPGEVLVGADIVSGSGPLALLPDGWMAVGIADLGDIGWFRIGDAASVLGGGRVVARRAVVLETRDGSVVVGVPADDAAAVAEAANRREAVVSLSASRQQ